MDLCPYLFCLSFYLLYFFLPPFKYNGLLFWVPDDLCQHSEVVLWNLLRVQMFFWWICGGESGLPVLFLHHLSTHPPPLCSLKRNTKPSGFGIFYLVSNLIQSKLFEIISCFYLYSFAKWSDLVFCAHTFAFICLLFIISMNCVPHCVPSLPGKVIKPLFPSPV